MIPHELRFHGVRDYGPTVIDLSGMGEHVLIAGPNGSGKSTITFCMGAVLDSSKVDVRGLRSRNLPDDETWRSEIHFLFKNEGPTRIDAPLYIEFSIMIEQVPNDPIKRIFVISEGDERENLEEKAIYRSGGQPNFGDYRLDLTDKYRVFPDDYYLIWYQQEVNQFAIMSPEERFRVFSEMHGIANIQKNWEKSLLQVKETESTVREAESAVRNDQLLMMDAKNMYERLKKHQKSIRNNGQTMIQTLLAINEITNQELVTNEETTEELLFEKEENEENLRMKQDDLRELQAKVETATRKVEQNRHALDQTAVKLTGKEQELQQLNNKEQELSERLREIEEKGRMLRYSEEETNSLFQAYQSKVTQIEKQEKLYANQLTDLMDEKEQIYDERAKLRSEIRSYQMRAKEYTDLLDQYQSKHEVQEKLQQLEEKISQQHLQGSDWEQEVMEAQKERGALEKNHVMSRRQLDVVTHFQQKGIRVYPLQALVELRENAPLEAEEKLAAIKYTVFYDGHHIKPINDLYHVSFRSIIPDHFIDQIPVLQLQMRSHLTNDEKTYAAKVLWWIQQFIATEKPYLKGSVLMDDRGLRGSQEQGTYILSERARIRRKQALDKWLAEKRQTLQQLKEQQTINQEEVKQLHRVIHRVAEAEAFGLEKPSYERKREVLENYENRLEWISEEENKIHQEIDHLRHENAKYLNLLTNLQADLDVYQQLGELSKQFECLQQFRQQLKELHVKIKQLSTKQDAEERGLHKSESEERALKHNISLTITKIEGLEREISSILKQIELKTEEREILEEGLLQKEKELLDLQQMIPEIYQETLELEPLTGRSKLALENQYIQAKREFEMTRAEDGINYEADQIYYKAKENYEQKSSELDQLKNLLTENIERAEENEQNLVTTIQMKVLRIHQSFQNYMTQFQFDCEISFDKYEERNGRVNFRLFIKARKQGHRGQMEEVGFKARAGRVGQGVSGGEESLSSLLFALSLLQELDINPSFIVLDEFDSALDEERKAKVFDLYAEILVRKLIVISPKGHEDQYLNHFGKAYIARHDSEAMNSSLVGIRNRTASSATI